MTEYAILKKDEKTNGWHRMEFTYGWKIEAPSARAAIQRVLKDTDDSASGEYMAIPARSWKPETVAVESALKFS